MLKLKLNTQVCVLMEYTFIFIFSCHNLHVFGIEVLKTHKYRKAFNLHYFHIAILGLRH